jgi:hypothetical protein
MYCYAFRAFTYVLNPFQKYVWEIEINFVCCTKCTGICIKKLLTKIVYLFCRDALFSCFQLLKLLPFEIFIEFGLPLRPPETDCWSGHGS